nr:MAG TPA: hypothetical protein [Caudoviricetes sp.]
MQFPELPCTINTSTEKLAETYCSSWVTRLKRYEELTSYRFYYCYTFCTYTFCLLGFTRTDYLILDGITSAA